MVKILETARIAKYRTRYRAVEILEFASREHGRRMEAAAAACFLYIFISVFMPCCVLRLRVVFMCACVYMSCNGARCDLRI